MTWLSDNRLDFWHVQKFLSAILQCEQFHGPISLVAADKGSVLNYSELVLILLELSLVRVMAKIAVLFETAVI